MASCAGDSDVDALADTEGSFVGDAVGDSDTEVDFDGAATGAPEELLPPKISRLNK